MALQVRGRGKLRITSHIDSHEVILRLDDDHRDEFWAEVHLSRLELVATIGMIDEAEQQERNHEAL